VACGPRKEEVTEGCATLRGVGVHNGSRSQKTNVGRALILRSELLGFYGRQYYTGSENGALCRNVAIRVAEYSYSIIPGKYLNCLSFSCVVLVAAPMSAFACEV
jgi:hypothetical protein